jgi:hypothetical protein
MELDPTRQEPTRQDLASCKMVKDKDLIRIKILLTQALIWINNF